ncbi:MAG: ABC transporter permease [Candidatus Aminicenantes bacterium]|nr:MAG: ABC transporter permease [Candidatus Aminicenantes bacterium]
MIRNYLKIAIRNLTRRKAYALINIGGLAAGLACCMVILLYVSNESSYDQYHRGGDRLYRVLECRKVPALEFCTARISAMVATVLKEYEGEVEKIARVFPVSNALIKHDNVKVFEDRVVYSESELFDVLTIPFLRGNPNSALDDMNSLVLTRRMAIKYFGDEDPLGQRVAIKDPAWNRLTRNNQFTDYVVTGVVADPPSNTHFKYDIFLPLQQFANTWLLREWHAGPTLTYLKLASGVTVPEFEKKIEKMAYDYVNKELSAWGQIRHYFLQAVTDIHFRRDFDGLAIRDDLEAPGNRIYLYIYGMIAMLILLIGCMNFINLSNARGVYRIKEVGLRKVIGAGRWQLIRQFLSESIIITFLAATCAILLTNGLLPFFNQFAGTTLRIQDSLHPQVFFSILGLILFVGTLSGLYPAFVLTAFRPDQILRGSRMGTRGSFALKILVVGQFAISIFLASGSITVYKQLNYMRSQDLGFDKEHKYVIHLRSNAQIRKQVKTMKTEFLRNPGVLGATASSSVPGRPMRKGYLKWSDDKLDKPLRLIFLSCDDDFLSQYKIDMVAGRAFDEKLNDENRAFIINEAAIPHLGYASIEEALGDRLHESFYGRWKTIVGVVKDFHYQGMRREIEPMYMEVSSSRYNMITLTLASANLSETLRSLETKWSGLFPTIPFDGFFLDDDFDKLYRKEAQMGKLLGILTTMGLVVACLGLLGLASFLVQHRTKEIGIRKVLGASIPSLMGLLSQQFVILVLLANIISVPLALYTLSLWLQDFAFRIQPDWGIFAAAGASALLCAVVPILVQSFWAARADPVESLRYE